ncbi:MAG TPA: hypothetical protein VLE74_02375 [Candidatus Saccharimonadales bacterium]|nr:hypothetical protein [Candidatus Saccharimonadales bacterium]
MKLKRNQQGSHHILIPLVIIVVVAVGFVGWRVAAKQKAKSNSSPSKILQSNASSDEKAIAAGKSLSNNQCKGTGETTFTHLPMNAADFSILIPYGETVGGHVTPIDHQYFSPTDFHSVKDKYPVYAMADALMTDIEVHPPENGSNGRIRMVFTVSCTFLYYYDLVTSVEPGIDKAHLPIQVKAGQLIGHIGGQTLDFAVWNTKKPLTGFINPASYDGEAWKIYTADPFPYYTTELRAIVVGKNPRQAEPIAGKIDYDIDGKLIGNWFLEGSGGYSGPSHGMGPSYWEGHLSIAPDLYDPSATVVSVGNYGAYPQYGPSSDTSNHSDNARQYFAEAASPDPAKVDKNSGAVKFELVQRQWLTSSGSLWDNSSYIQAPKAKTTGPVFGTVLAQVLDGGKLKFEVFPGKNATQVSGFTSAAKTYTR